MSRYRHGGKYSYDSETGKINGGTITLEWVEVKYEHFVGFNTVDAVLETPDYERYLFRDNSQTVIAPTVTYLDAINKVLAYWKNQDDKTGTVRQYLPGEQVTEPDGTKFYAVTIRPDAHVLLVSNDKLFEENGMRICISDRPTWWTLEDGTRVVSWNTQADGKGTAYAPNTEIDLSGRTTPLVLYAQWKKPVYVAKVEEPKPNEPKTGGTLTIKPRPTPAPDPGTGTGPEPTEPEKPAPITEKQKVLVGVYRWGMMIAVLQGETDKKGEEIYCTVPKGLDLTGCALKLFVLSEAYAPDRKVEFILLSE